MRSTSAVLSAVVAAASVAVAQRPANMSLCNYYADAVFNTTNANATLQYGLLTALVNTAVIGNYSSNPGSLNAVTGILNNGTYNGQEVSLLKYFNGMLASTNRNGSAVSVNFLDGGGADPLTNSTPASDTDSNQYFLLTHLYQYFGGVLNCSGYGSDVFPAYEGGKSQYEVHKFMNLDEIEVGYFIQEVGLAATSFGVTDADATAIGSTLSSIFNVRCAAPATVIPAQGPQLQSICIAESCPQAANASCALYERSTEPVAGNSSNSFTSRPTASPTGGSGSGSSGGDASATDSGSETSETSDSDSGASVAVVSSGLGALAMGIAGVFALAAAL